MSPPARAETALREAARERSLALLARNSLPEGFVASSATEHYAAIWARDALLTGIGASVTGDAALLATLSRTLVTLARLQGPMGQIPNAYWPGRQYWDWGEAGCVDGAALWVIAARQYHARTGDLALVRDLWPSLRRTFDWLRCQDVNNMGLLTSAEASDWMDSTLNRSGKVLYVNVLYYWAARCMAALGGLLGQEPPIDPADVRCTLNLLFWPEDPQAYDRVLRHVAYPAAADRAFPHPASAAAHRAAIRPRQHYVSHIAYARVVDRCDVLGNLLAILCGVADRERAERILGYLRAAAIDRPYPVRVWPEPEEPGAGGTGMLKADIERFQEPQWCNPPYSYHNGAVWPFVGGVYVAALAATGRRAEARRALAGLAEANRQGATGEWEFREWLHGQTGAPGGAAAQSWNAGCYLLAYHALRGETLAF